MDTTQTLVLLMGAGGGGAAVLALITGLFKWLSGSAIRERDKNTDLMSQRSDAIVERNRAMTNRDEADKRRRRAYEYASLLRRMLIEHGIKPPIWPLDGDGPDTTETGPIPTQIEE